MISTTFLGILLLTAFIVNVILTRILIKLAKRYNLVDKPSNDCLKIHSHSIPYLGGVGIFCIIFFSCILFMNELNLEGVNILSILVALSILFIVGLVDDIKNISPKIRLFWQIIASAIIVFVSELNIELFSFTILNDLLTILFLLFMINALNLLDGMDALAGSISFIAFLFFGIGFYFLGIHFVLYFSIIMCGALSAFLTFNKKPAKIYLGDNGSTLLGFCLGILSIMFFSNGQQLHHAVFILLNLLIPITDASFAILRRLKNKKNIFLGDRHHIYDWLERKGLSQNQSVFSLLMANIIFSSIATLIICPQFSLQ